MASKSRIACASLVLATSFTASAAPEPGPAVPALRLYVFNCGTAEVADIAVFSPGVNKGKKKTLTDACYLVAHPKGTLMWDTGFPDALADMPEGKKVGEGFHVRLNKSLAGQLKEIGYAPQAVSYLGLSHMHFDHVGNVALFPQARLLIQKEEHESAFGPDAAKYGNDPANYPTLAKNPVTLLSGDHDVFGDGTVVIKRAAGHTPGHQSLFLKLPKTGNIVLSGDLAHFQDNWMHRRVPSFNHDKEMSVRAMDDMAAFMKANKAKLWIQHDPEQGRKTRYAPKFYE